MKKSENQWMQLIHQLGKDFKERAVQHDQDDSFVEENYSALKEHRFLAAAIPQELGGGGLTHSQMCNMLKTLAHYCSSTALANSMHQHLLAANIWKYKHGQGAEEMLRKVAENQPVLVSTGAGDWLESNGEMKKTEGGYVVNAMKHFASQSAIGDILVTSARYEDPEQDSQVLHFPVPFSSEGVSSLNNWLAMGMRGTGSHTVRLENVFVPDSAIALQRKQGEFHPFWNVVITAAMPMIMSVYVGIAERAVQIAIENSKRTERKKSYTVGLVGEMNNQLTTAQVLLKDMIAISNDLKFEAVDQNSHEILTRKTGVANACQEAVTKAMEVVGGQGFFRKFGLERLYRDVHAGKYHPLQEKDQQLFSGEFLLQGSL